MDNEKQQFQNSWDGENGGKKRQMKSMLVAHIRLECTCTNLFFSQIATNDLDSEIIRICKLCNRLHRFAWIIETRDVEKENEEEDD